MDCHPLEIARHEHGGRQGALNIYTSPTSSRVAKAPEKLIRTELNRELDKLPHREKNPLKKRLQPRPVRGGNLGRVSRFFPPSPPMLPPPIPGGIAAGVACTLRPAELPPSMDWLLVVF